MFSLYVLVRDHENIYFSGRKLDLVPIHWAIEIFQDYTKLAMFATRGHIGVSKIFKQKNLHFGLTWNLLLSDLPKMALLINWDFKVSCDKRQAWMA